MPVLDIIKAKDLAVGSINENSTIHYEVFVLCSRIVFFGFWILFSFPHILKLILCTNFAKIGRTNAESIFPVKTAVCLLSACAVNGNCIII